MTTDWLLRVGDGKNLIRSAQFNIWGINSTTPTNKHFVRNVMPGDRLWFIKSKSHGKILAVATYNSHKERELGPLVDISMTNEELGWTNEDTNWTSDTEIHYTNLYNVSDCEMLTYIKSPSTIRKYDVKCKVELAIEYSSIVKYSKVTLKL